VSATAAGATGARVVVSWDDPGGDGVVAAIDADPPFAFATPELAVGADGIARAAGGRLLHLSRAQGVLSLVDPATWSVTGSFALGASSFPRDVAVVGGDVAYVSRRDARHLLRLDLGSGAVAEAVDLAPLGAGDGNPAQDTMLVHAGRLYLQLAGEPGFPPQPHAIAVIDLASETLVDADPGAPGIQGIALVGTGPRFKMQIVPGANRLMVSATGAFHDDGGLELVDLDALASLGLVVREQIDAGADVGGFTMTGAGGGWMVFSTDLLLSSHLHAFTFEKGMDPFEADVSLDYFATALVHHAASETLFWPEPGGVQAFDATTGAPRAEPTPVAGLVTDLELLPAVGDVPAVPAWAALALAALLATRARVCAGRSRPRGAG
jgi:hypothetical protein